MRNDRIDYVFAATCSWRWGTWLQTAPCCPIGWWWVSCPIEVASPCLAPSSGAVLCGRGSRSCFLPQEGLTPAGPLARSPHVLLTGWKEATRRGPARLRFLHTLNASHTWRCEFVLCLNSIICAIWKAIGIFDVEKIWGFYKQCCVVFNNAGSTRIKLESSWWGFVITVSTVCGVLRISLYTKDIYIYFKKV